MTNELRSHFKEKECNNSLAAITAAERSKIRERQKSLSVVPLENVSS